MFGKSYESNGIHHLPSIQLKYMAQKIKLVVETSIFRSNKSQDSFFSHHFFEC